MICPKCGKDTEGNYCSHCGFHLPSSPEMGRGRSRRRVEPDEERQDEYDLSSRERDRHHPAKQKNRREKKKKKKLSFPSLPKIKVPGGLITLFVRASQIFCAILMLWIAWLPVTAFWKGKEGLGSVSFLITERNYSLTCYLALIGVYVLFTLVSALWILTKRHFANKERVISVDMGRGITAFLLLALAAWSVPWVEAVAAGQNLLPGAERFLEVMKPLSEQIFHCSVLGVFLSVCRRLLKR